jgi:hypothetical protein
MADAPDDPSAMSGDYKAMSDYWTMVEAILCGAPGMRSTGAQAYTYSVPGPREAVGQLAQLQFADFVPQSPYLPKFPNEDGADYDRRRRYAPLTNIYADISSNLAAKPFAKTLELEEGSPADLEKLAENIDGQGNSLHVFGRALFKSALDKGIDWVLIDYTRVPPGATLADERGMGARPYWVHVEAERLLAVYSEFLNGQEVIFHARIHEPAVELVGYAEVAIDRVRVFRRERLVNDVRQTVGFGPPVWELWESISDERANTTVWQQIDGGPVTVGVIPLVPFMTGKRRGNSWRVEPPLRDLAYLQVEEFQQESNLKNVKELAGFPMLAGNGVMPPEDEGGRRIIVPVGPKTVLFAPPSNEGRGHGEWAFCEPAASSMTFLQADLEKLRTEMRDLGMQPLTTANLTVITTANVSMKAHSAVQAWALGFKDALEQAWIITCKWLGRNESPVVKVHTDFAVDFEAGSELDALLKAEAQAILSKRTVQDEFKRRGVLSDDFDAAEEEQRLAEEQQGLAPEQAIDPRTGMPVNMPPVAQQQMPPQQQPPSQVPPQQVQRSVN